MRKRSQAFSRHGKEESLTAAKVIMGINLDLRQHDLSRPSIRSSIAIGTDARFRPEYGSTLKGQSKSRRSPPQFAFLEAFAHLHLSGADHGSVLVGEERLDPAVQ
jgi:hypothetical protein